MKKHKIKLIAAVLIVAVLAAAFFMGGAPGGSDDAAEKPADQVTQQLPQEDTQAQQPDKTPEQIVTVPEAPTEPAEQGTTDPEQPAETEKPADTQTPPKQEETSQQPTMEIDPETGKDQYSTDPVPEGKPVPVEPENTTVTAATYTCTLSISCATILDNMDDLDPDKVDIVPADGWILQSMTVTFNEGESVFDVLQRVCREQKIHMEFMDTPMYNSAYIEGIANLYEFDCGPLSGWMYKVNEWFPNYGCSRYALQDGDVVNWVYTCDLGEDVGDNSMVG